MIWLGIETSNSPLSIAIVKDGQVLAEIVQNNKLTHSVTAMPTIEEVFKKAKLNPSDIDAIAVAQGPGSYTGIRIGVTIAKTLAWTMKKPLVGISSLKTLAANVKIFNGLICPIFDARRQNVYAGVYKGKELETVLEDQHLSLEDLLMEIKKQDEPVVFIGLDVDKFKEDIIAQLGNQANFAPYSYQLPRAGSMIELAEKEQLLSANEVHTFVPKYHRIAQAEATWIKEQKKGHE